MGIDQLSQLGIWLIIVHSKENLAAAEKDLIADLVDEDARDSQPNNIVLRDIFESSRHSRIVVEGTRAEILDLVEMLGANTPYRMRVKWLESA